jgi:NDP-sugar pyrophosphorylase family protein
MTAMPPLAILAGGLATRLKPLTEQVPKSMIEVGGQPFIAHQLRLLRRERIDRVVVCLGHLGEQIEAFVGDGGQFGVSVTYCYDGSRLLGTGGALRLALDHLGPEFLVMYGDSWLDTQFAPVVDAFRASGKSALMTVYRNSDRWDRSNIWFENGQIRVYDKKNRLPQMHYIDWGLSMTRADVIAARSVGTAFDLAEVYGQLAQNSDLGGYEIATRFYEIGSPDGFRETDLLLRNKV